MKYKLLLIEDDEIFTFLLKKAMQKTGMPSATGVFINGLEALEYLKKEYCLEDNFVLFLDLNMPVMNGWQFLETLHHVAQPKNCMVFILTSSNYQKDLHKLEENPFVLATVSKPITTYIMEGLKEKITLKLKEHTMK